MKLITILIFSVLLLSSCIGSNARVQELPLPPQPIKHPAFTLLPPAETGWLVANMNQYNLSLAKRGNASDETYAIQVMLYQLPTFNSDETFKKYVIDGFNKDTDSTRFNIINSKNEIININTLHCVKNRTATEDTQSVKQTSNDKNMILEVVNYTCKHPTIKNVGANISYSHRYYTGHADTKLDSHSVELMNGFKFNQ